MQICDRAYARNQSVVRATQTVTFGEERFHLCDEEYEAVREFIIAPEPAASKPRGRPPKPRQAA